MKTLMPTPLALAGTAAALLAACSNPYALRLGSINYTASQTPGVIQFTDPKLYKREALINERRTEFGFLEKLLKDSETIKIEPEIVRELEVIRAVAASVGLKFDPAAAVEFRRANEVGDIEQRIQVTRLEMQLSQLQRDAELLRQRLPQQTDPSATPGTPGTTVTRLPAGLTPPDPTKILEVLNALRQTVTDRLDKKAEPPAKSTGAASPLDDFRDRRAYRDALKDAMNLVSLDELHDKDGNSLYRLQLQATSLPGQEHLDTLGILRMEVVPPVMDDAEIQKLYQEWLWHVNQTLNIPPDSRQPLAEQRFDSDPRLLTLGDAGELFTVMKIEIPKRGGDSDGKSCKGVHKASRKISECWYPQVALPGRRGAVFTEPEMDLDRSMQGPDIVRTTLAHALSDIQDTELARSLFLLDSSCARFANAAGRDRKVGPEPDAARPDEKKDKRLTASETLALATTLHRVWPQLGNPMRYVANALPSGTMASGQLSDGVEAALRDLNEFRLQAQKFLDLLGDLNPACRRQLVQIDPVKAPDGFRDAIAGEGGEGKGRVTVYEVAPTERTQRVSTVARAADAVAMAAAIAGQLPQAGFGGSGNFAFTRTAIGKADAIERAPLVVGFAEPVHYSTTANAYPAFGWLLGPKVTLDPKKQELVLQHHLAPYEIHADMSLPGWWPFFELKASTAWAPNWRNANGTTLTPGEQTRDRQVRVPMRHNSGDMDGLTALILRKSTGQQVDRPRIRRTDPVVLSRCAGPVTVAIEGDGIWRATAVHVGGFQVDAANIRVLPDMRGIAATVDVGKIPVEGRSATIQVWTHNGSDLSTLQFTDARQADGNCVRKEVATTSKEAPVIEEVVPAQISLCESDALFTVRGKNLTGDLQAALGTIEAKATALKPDDGTLIEVKAPINDRAHKIGKLAELPLVVRTVKGAASRPVTIVASDCPKDQAATLPDQPSIAEVIPNAVSRCDPEFTLTVRGKGLKGIDPARLGTLTARVTETKEDGTLVTLTVKNEQPALKINELKHLTLMVRTPQGLATEAVEVKGRHCP